MCKISLWLDCRESVRCQGMSSFQRQNKKCLNKPLLEIAEGRNNLRGVRRNAIQMTDYTDKMLVLKFPKIRMLQWVKYTC